MKKSKINIRCSVYGGAGCVYKDRPLSAMYRITVSSKMEK